MRRGFYSYYCTSILATRRSVGANVPCLSDTPSLPSIRTNTSMSNPSLHVTHAPDASRFELLVDGHTAYLDYIQTAVNLVISHTEVPTEVEGRGAGSSLVEAVLAYADTEGVPVIPICPFARAYIRNRRWKAPRA